MLSGNVCKYRFLTREDGLLKRGLLEKAAAIKKLEYLPLSSELKNWHCKDQYKLFKDQINGG